MVDWFENDELFFEQARIGQKWQEFVTGQLNKQRGIEATCSELSIRKDISQRGAYANQRDILVRVADRRYKLECKSRSLRFTCKKDFPFPTTTVETVGSFQGRTWVPDFWVMVSQRDKGMIVLSKKTIKYWTVKDTYDTVRKITDATYYCHVKYAMDFDDFVARLRLGR